MGVTRQPILHEIATYGADHEKCIWRVPTTELSGEPEGQKVWSVHAFLAQTSSSTFTVAPTLFWARWIGAGSVGCCQLRKPIDLLGLGLLDSSVSLPSGAIASPSSGSKIAVSSNRALATSSNVSPDRAVSCSFKQEHGVGDRKGVTKRGHWFSFRCQFSFNPISRRLHYDITSI